MKRVSLILSWMVLLASSLVMAADRSTDQTSDWPTWLGDQNRSGSSEEKLSGDLKPAWAWRARHAPSPALAPPRGSAKDGGLGKPLVQTSTSDNAFQVVIAGGKLYFGSSVEESLTCLNVADGKRLWTFYSEGAIRFAPLCHEGKVYFGSDDGYVYCLDGASGELVWKFQAAIGERRIIANVILSETAFESGKLPFSLHAVFPMLQPCGGLMMIAGRLDEQTLRRWGKSIEGWTVRDEDGLRTGSVVRGKLPGSGGRGRSQAGTGPNRRLRHRLSPRRRRPAGAPVRRASLQGGEGSPDRGVESREGLPT